MEAMVGGPPVPPTILVAHRTAFPHAAALNWRAGWLLRPHRTWQRLPRRRWRLRPESRCPQHFADGGADVRRCGWFAVERDSGIPLGEACGQCRLTAACSGSPATGTACRMAAATVP
ncbi:hypothetical protein GCM10027360_33130 [Amycolatopsis echigonensis]